MRVNKSLLEVERTLFVLSPGFAKHKKDVLFFLKGKMEKFIFGILAVVAFGASIVLLVNQCYISTPVFGSTI